MFSLETSMGSPSAAFARSTVCPLMLKMVALARSVGFSPLTNNWFPMSEMVICAAVSLPACPMPVVEWVNWMFFTSDKFPDGFCFRGCPRNVHPVFTKINLLDVLQRVLTCLASVLSGDNKLDLRLSR